jgi:dynactin complex subunit
MTKNILKGTFRFGSDIIEVIFDGNNVMFMDASSGMITSLEGLRISHDGVVKQFPDLKKREDWKKEAIERLKKHIKKFKNQNDKLNYVKDELVKYGYTPLYKQKAGFRPTKF